MPTDKDCDNNHQLRKIKKKKRNDDLCEVQCPVCGYYCLGKGGFGCINKPSIVIPE